MATFKKSGISLREDLQKKKEVYGYSNLMYGSGHRFNDANFLCNLNSGVDHAFRKQL